MGKRLRHIVAQLKCERGSSMVEAGRGFRRRPETRLRLEPVQVSPDVFQGIR